MGSLISSTLLLSLLITFLFLLSLTNAIDLNVITDFGAKGDGKTDVNKAFSSAWAAACKSSEASTIHIPHKGRFLLSPIEFQGPCNNSKITFLMDGILVAPDYKKMESSENWIMFYGVDGVSITGRGYLDGQGTSLWECKAAGNNDCPTGAASLSFYSSKNILVQNVGSTNAKLFHIVLYSSQNVAIQGVSINAPGDSPNTDGIHVQNSNKVRIFNASIRTGDDCISIGPGTQNMTIQRITCGPGHGISIGSLGSGEEEEIVQNVVVKSVVFNGTQNGVRIKAWGRPSNGFVKGVAFKQVVMKNVQNPIVIDQNYCPHNTDCPHKNSGIQISGVTYTNIVGTSATQVAMFFNCSSTSPCKGIGLEDIKLTYNDQTAQSFCKNVHGTASGVVSPKSCL
ncbi:polygalacturonase-like [Macadamia integrifolia]|uniref:polygalacturonase-like n=1 Tax=Macadamia integrifolia TaxID=60698 RepID=UPI001C4E4A76|nr:polygalacturonase-like [Macadamia integrifolia]